MRCSGPSLKRSGNHSELSEVVDERDEAGSARTGRARVWPGTADRVAARLCRRAERAAVASRLSRAPVYSAREFAVMGQVLGLVACLAVPFGLFYGLGRVARWQAGRRDPIDSLIKEPRWLKD